MRQTFLNENFLLQNEAGRELYHDYAKELPIIDYHSHLSPAAIAKNQRFNNLTQIWLDGDHYKWRAMRALGIDENYITGSKSDHEKFLKWAEAVPQTIRNPLFHWTHLELKNYFCVDKLLNPDTANAIYNGCNERLAGDGFDVRGLLNKMKVEVVCTTDGISDNLKHHQTMNNNGACLTMLPTFRPDDVLAIENAAQFKSGINKLAEKTNIEINNLDDLLSAIQKRIDFFHDHGTRLSDHGLEQLYSIDFNPSEVERSFQKVLNGKPIDRKDEISYQSMILFHLSQMYHAKGWVQQFHLGAIRNVNTRQTALLGKDTGFDSIGDTSQAMHMARFFDRLEAENKLTKTIIYNLNPGDNAVFAAMVSNFNDGSIKGKMQFGAAWWFLDTKEGMENQLNTLSNIGLLSNFVGMLTDSRSFLSFPRHEYFRRILCNLIGKDIENGELPYDMKWIGKIVEDICYNNAKTYFEF